MCDGLLDNLFEVSLAPLKERHVYFQSKAFKQGLIVQSFRKQAVYNIIIIASVNSLI
jgi:hypothetical protein